MAKKYKCVFFDLDHTLWDYDTNARETLGELYATYGLAERGVPDADTFYRQFNRVNNALWELFDTNQIDQKYIRQERFKQILGHFGAYEQKLGDDLSEDYLLQCPKKANLIPHALDVLDYLSPTYSLTLITNGFEEIQRLKLTAGNITHYFAHIITSQKAGHRKPAGEIFRFALDCNGVACSDAVMVGDNLVTDIGGARAASIDSVFYNPNRLPHNAVVSHEISCLSELKKIL